MEAIWKFNFADEDDREMHKIMLDAQTMKYAIESYRNILRSAEKHGHETYHGDTIQYLREQFYECFGYVLD